MPTLSGVLPDPYVPAPVLEHCPHCRGAVRPGAPWCTQCWADLRPAPGDLSERTVSLPEADAEASPRLRVEPAAPRGDGGSPTGPDSRPEWPCSTCGGTNPMELPVCANCGASFLAAVKSDAAPLLALPLVGDLARLGKAQRYVLASAVVLVALAAVLLVGLLSS